MIKTLLIIALLLTVASAVRCVLLASHAVHGARYTLEDTLEHFRKIDGLRAAEAAELPWEPFDTQSFDGYLLHGLICRQPEPTNKVVILTHGYTVNRNASLKYVPLFRDLGYHCIIYDDRGHGLNEPWICSFSLTESRDLMAVIRKAVDEFGDNIFLGLHGESLGAATQIRALRYHPPVKFVVNDCGFSEIVPVLKVGLRGMHLPGFMVYGASQACELLYGYAFTKARPIDSLRGNRVPICFIHGAADDFITPDHSERMRAATEGYSELHLFPGAAHAMSLQSNPEEYERVVRTFVRKIEAEAEESRDTAGGTRRQNSPEPL